MKMWIMQQDLVLDVRMVGVMVRWGKGKGEMLKKEDDGNGMEGVRLE